MVTFLVVLVLLGAVFEFLSLKDNLAKISYHAIPSKLGYEPGEVFQLITTVANYGYRAIPLLRLEETFPEGIQNASLLQIRGRQKITRTVQASLSKRGVYYLEGCRLSCGDFLGVRENTKEIRQREEFVIFPELLQSASVLQALSGYYGDFSARRFYTEDPILVSSFRSYTGREPMRSISWAQSARKNELMVKEFDHTTELSITILLDVYLHWSEGAHAEQLEYCFSLVRTIADFLEQKRASYRLLTNSYIRNGSTFYEVLSTPGQGPNHYTTLLFTLARSIPDSFRSIDDLYQMVIRSYSGENAIFYVAPFENEKRDKLVKSLKDRLSCQIYSFYASKEMEGEQDDC